MSWWARKPMRLVQTNLREIDVPFDVDDFVASLQELAAEVVIFNVGGIVANYPTAFPWHWRNPRVDGPFLGRLLDVVHAAGMYLIARCLWRGGEAPLEFLGDRRWRVTVPELGPFECVAIEMEHPARDAGAAVGEEADAHH